MEIRQEHSRILAQIPQLLAGLLEMSPAEIDVSRDPLEGAGLVVTAADYLFLVDVKLSTSSAQVMSAARKLREKTAQWPKPAVPLLVVPFMGDVGRRACLQEGVGWFDLSGNACIHSPGLKVIVSGHPNRFVRAGRPPNLFAPKSSRIARWLLVHVGQSFTQRELARASHLDEGFVSRIVAGLTKEEYVSREETGAVRPKDPGVMLEAWREGYQFQKHALIQGHVAARSGDALLKSLAEALGRRNLTYAATGLAGAWALTRFAAFRLAAIYVPEDPPPSLLEEIGFRAEARGSNLCWVLPNDEGVFQGAADVNGIRCAHPVQVYLDLKEQPERSAEAADNLLRTLLPWSRNG